MGSYNGPVAALLGSLKTVLLAALDGINGLLDEEQNRSVQLGEYQVTLPKQAEDCVFGTAAGITLRTSRLVGATTILHLGCADAPWNNWDLPEEYEPDSRGDYAAKGVLEVSGPAGFKSRLPFIGTAMRPLGRVSMVQEFARHGVLARIHRYFVPHKEANARGWTAAQVQSINIERSVKRWKEIMDWLRTEFGDERAKELEPFMAVAPTSGGMVHVRALLEAGCTRFDVDTMGGLPKSLRFARELHAATRSVLGALIISGSVSSPEGVAAVAPYSDFIDMGVGNGKSCSTRPEIGIGLHQGYAIASASGCLREMGLLYRESGKGCLIIASGGFLETHDRGYALALGADLVTFGSSTQMCIESGAKTQQNPITKVYEVQVYGMASAAVARAYSLTGTEDLPEGDDYWIPFPGGETARPRFADRLRALCKSIGGTLSSIGAPVLPGAIEFLRQSPTFYYRAPGAELENGTPGKNVLTGR